MEELPPSLPTRRPARELRVAVVLQRSPSEADGSTDALPEERLTRQASADSRAFLPSSTYRSDSTSMGSMVALTSAITDSYASCKNNFTGAAVRIAGFKRSQRRDDLIAQGVPSERVDGHIAHMNMGDELLQVYLPRLLALFTALIVFVALTLCFLVWLAISLWTQGRTCEGPLPAWAIVAICLPLFNLTFCGAWSCCRGLDRAVLCRGCPLSACFAVTAVFPVVWPILGLHWVHVDRQVEHAPCGEVASSFCMAIVAYSAAALVWSIILVGLLGFAAVLLRLGRCGYLRTSHAAPPGTLERHATVVAVTDIVDQDASSCPICIEKFKEEEEIVLTSCSHFFHKACLEGWLKAGRGCPLCRVDFSTHPDKHSNGCVDIDAANDPAELERDWVKE